LISTFENIAKYCFAFLLLIYFTEQTLSQELSQQFINSEEFVQHLEQSQRTHHFEPSVISGEIDNKCGLWISFTVARNWDSFSSTQRARLSQALSPLQHDRDTINGHFRIQFDTSGLNEPAILDANHQRVPHSWQAYVDSVGRLFNYAWDYMINSMGYLPPPFESGQSYYNISIEELGKDFYGETRFVDLINSNPSRYSTYIRIDNDYLGFYSQGMAGLKVTSVHEFHHAIQLGSYGFWNNEQYFYEITSTWMEDVFYNDVNDYYQYLRDEYSPRKGQFSQPDISFNSSSPFVTYSRAIWGKFVEKRFSQDVMRHCWDYIKSGHTLPAIDRALTDAGSSFRHAFIEWTIWNYNTGPYCDTLKYYTEGRNYPSMLFRLPVEYINTQRSFSDTIQVISSAYHPICFLSSSTDNCNLSPQIVAIISNLNINESSGKKVGFSYDISNTSGQGFAELANGIFVRLNTPDPENWISQESVPKIISSILVYPNPFIPKGSKPLSFRLPPVMQSSATLYIYSSSMDKILAKELEVISQNFEPQIAWDGHDINGNIVPTGVYFYVISIDGKQYTGKIAVIKE
jgi:hypothetical protein